VGEPSLGSLSSKDSAASLCRAILNDMPCHLQTRLHPTCDHPQHSSSLHGLLVATTDVLSLFLAIAARPSMSIGPGPPPSRWSASALNLHLLTCASQVVAQLRPRYPMYGGWSADFVFGYSLPLSPFVAKLPGGALQLTAWLGPAVRDLVTEDLTVKVRGPKAALCMQYLAILGHWHPAAEGYAASVPQRTGHLVNLCN